MRLAFLVLVVLFATACGQKGPLYLREYPPAGVKPPKPESYKPQPYPKDAPREAGEDEAAEGAKK
jgi:predicted small lipoprotein YifL